MEKKTTEAPVLEVFEDQDEDGLDALVNSAFENNKTSFKRTNTANYAEAEGKKRETNIPNAKAPNPGASENQTDNVTAEEPRDDSTAKK